MQAEPPRASAAFASLAVWPDASDATVNANSAGAASNTKGGW
jgi:hypothetical protein